MSPGELLERAGVNDQVKRRALFRAGNALETRWKLVLKRPGSGRVYRHRFVTIDGRVVPIETRTPHQASAPGEPPASDTGRSAASIGVEDLPDEANPSVRVGTNVKSLRWLQDGVFQHPGGITIEPRPHADVALEEAREIMRTVMVAELRRATKSGA